MPDVVSLNICSFHIQIQSVNCFFSLVIIGMTAQNNLLKTVVDDLDLSHSVTQLTSKQTLSTETSNRWSFLDKMIKLSAFSLREGIMYPHLTALQTAFISQ